MAPVTEQWANDILKVPPVNSTPQQLELWKSTAAWNEENKSGTRVLASRVPSLMLEMRKWGWGDTMAIHKVAKLELHSQDKYITGNHDTYDRLWEDYNDIRNPHAREDYNRRLDGVSLKQTTMLYREVQTAMKAGEHKYNLEYPHKGLNLLDSNRRALRFILVKRWRVLLRLVRHLLPESYDPDEVEI